MRGVYWHKGRQMWLAQPTIHGESLYIGYYAEKKYAEQVVWNAIERAGPWIKPKPTPAQCGRSVYIGVDWDGRSKLWMAGDIGFETEQLASDEYIKQATGLDLIRIPGFNGWYATDGERVMKVGTRRWVKGKDGIFALDRGDGSVITGTIEELMKSTLGEMDPLDFAKNGRVTWDSAIKKWMIDGRVAPSQKSAWNSIYRKDGLPRQVIRRRPMLLPPNLGYYTEVDKNKPGHTLTPHRAIKIPSSMTPGVSFNKKAGKWVAYCKKKHLGSYSTEELAKEALEAAKNG